MGVVTTNGHAQKFFTSTFIIDHPNSQNPEIATEYTRATTENLCINYNKHLPGVIYLIICPAIEQSDWSEYYNHGIGSNKTACTIYNLYVDHLVYRAPA